MCSVVEIKNDSEYYIYYQSPESLETVTPQQQSLEYHSLFRVNDEKDDDDEMDDTLKSDEESEEETQQNSIKTEDDKDFSLEEIVTKTVPINEKECFKEVNKVKNLVKDFEDIGNIATDKVSKADPKDSIQENSCDDEIEYNEEHIDDILNDNQETEDVNIHYDWSVKGL